MELTSHTRSQTVDSIFSFLGKELAHKYVSIIFGKRLRGE